MYFLHWILGLIHFIVFFSSSIYGFVSKRTFVDIMLLLGWTLTIVSWPFYNGECFLSYYVKKSQNKHYQAGQASMELSDLHIFLANETLSYYLLNVLAYLNLGSLGILFYRNNFPFILYFPFLLSTFMYITILRIEQKPFSTNKSVQEFQYVYTVLILYLFIMLVLHYFQLRISSP